MVKLNNCPAVYRHYNFKLSDKVIFILLAFTTITTSCRQEVYKNVVGDASKTSNVQVGKAEIKYAKGFSIFYYKGFKLINIYNRVNDGVDTVKYLLIKKGQDIPSGFGNVQVIETPLKSMIGLSSMHIAVVDFAESDNILKGLGNLKYVSSPVVRNNIKAGKIKEVGLDGNLNNEAILDMHPGLVMAMGNQNAKGTRYKILTDAGIPVMQNSEFLESTPLGRAEWVKVMGALVDKEDLVNKKFSTLELEYNKLVQLAKNVTSKPNVITGMPFKGTWFVPEGDSYLTHFIEDAGGANKWAGTHGIGSLPLNFEAVAPEALHATYWINIGYVDSKKDITAQDTRFADFNPFKNGNLFNNNKLTNDLGSNDYWESGAVNPQVVLADLIKILHPELLPNHQLVYYKQLK